VAVRVVDIGGVVDYHHGLSFLFNAIHI